MIVCIFVSMGCAFHFIVNNIVVIATTIDVHTLSLKLRTSYPNICQLLSLYSKSCKT